MCLDLLCERTEHGVKLGCIGLSKEPRAESSRKKTLIVAMMMESSPRATLYQPRGLNFKAPRVMGESKRARDSIESVGEGEVGKESENELVDSSPPAKKARQSEEYTLGNVISLLVEKNSLLAGNAL